MSVDPDREEPSAASTEAWLRAVALEVQRKVDALYRAAHTVEAGSALDQAGLRDGADIVEGYLKHGERGLALDHVLYMVTETEITLSSEAFAALELAGRAMGLDARRWARVRRGAR